PPAAASGKIVAGIRGDGIGAYAAVGSRRARVSGGEGIEPAQRRRCADAPPYRTRRQRRTAAGGGSLCCAAGRAGKPRVRNRRSLLRGAGVLRVADDACRCITSIGAAFALPSW